MSDVATILDDELTIPVADIQGVIPYSLEEIRQKHDPRLWATLEALRLEHQAFMGTGETDSAKAYDNGFDDGRSDGWYDARYNVIAYLDDLIAGYESEVCLAVAYRIRSWVSENL